jgi:hypothetical protein
MDEAALGGFILGFIFWIVAILILLAFIRWFFRINEIADYLKRIADRLAPDIPDLTEVKTALKQGRCDYCHKYFPPDKLTKTDSGNMTCPTCAKLL